MKSYLVLTLCLVAVSGSTAAAQALDSALAYFPMAVGNTWQYAQYIDYVSVGTLQGYSTLRVIGDSTMPNGKKYKVFSGRDYISGQSIPICLRMDSTGANIYEPNPSVGGGEQLWDSLLARPHDGSRSGNNLYIFRDTILGVPTVIRNYMLLIDGPYRELAYNLGPVWFMYIAYDQFARIDELVYAKIDGHEYGTLVSVNATAESTPKEFGLSQNYPNPFNPSTTIRFALPQRAHVRMTVFNALGQQVAHLVDEMEEPGEHIARFDGSHLASGVYFYRLQAGEFVQTKKLVILR
jgi:hypothetical protein